jgi:hypothetical protein
MRCEQELFEWKRLDNPVARRVGAYGHHELRQRRCRALARLTVGWHVGICMRRERLNPCISASYTRKWSSLSTVKPDVVLQSARSINAASSLQLPRWLAARGRSYAMRSACMRSPRPAHARGSSIRRHRTCRRAVSVCRGRTTATTPDRTRIERLAASRVWDARKVNSCGFGGARATASLTLDSRK